MKPLEQSTKHLKKTKHQFYTISSRKQRRKEHMPTYFMRPVLYSNQRKKGKKGQEGGKDVLPHPYPQKEGRFIFKSG